MQFETNPEIINLMFNTLVTVSGPLPSTIFAEILLRRCISDLPKNLVIHRHVLCVTNYCVAFDWFTVDNALPAITPSPFSRLRVSDPALVKTQRDALPH